ncbi:MAG TPA: peroxidase [Candidatus Marinimicrobia bacterium]|jgi:alkylhydroperoxidase family enzyme|nr:peroxidase [Candidatus Neomarinimicrobiota bacterium]
MAWIDTINEGDANGSLKDQYEKLKDSRNGVDNILKIHSLNPESLDAHVRLYKTIMYGKSPIRRVNREMIAVLVSSINQCHY